MKKLVCLLAVLVMSLAVSAGTIAAVDSYGVNTQLGTDGYPVSSTNSWSGKWIKDSNVSFASLGVSAGVSVPGTPAFNQYSGVGFADATATDYFSMTVTLKDGYVFGDNTQLYYGGIARSGSGPVSGKTTMIVSGVETALETLYTINTTSSYRNQILDLSSLDGVGGSVEFRWYAWGASSDLGTFRIGDHYSAGTYTDAGLYGSVVAVPEPATMMLLGLGGLLFARKK